MSSKQIQKVCSLFKLSPLEKSISQVLPTIPIALEKLSFNCLHHKAHIGLSRKARCRKSQQHKIGILSKMNNPRAMKNPTNSIMSQVAFVNLQPSLVQSKLLSPFRTQIRSFSSSSTDHFVTDEADFDTTLHEREFEMHRHERGPVSKIINFSKNAVRKVDGKKMILDIASSPFDPSLVLAKELSGASVFTISSSHDMLKSISDKIVEDGIQNVSTELSDLDKLVEFEDGTFDLVISCYGLQHVKYPSQLMSEIHRVLKPGGTMILATWDRLGTEPVVNRILQKVTMMNQLDIKMNHQLTKPHVLEKLIEDVGLKVVNIHRGEYPLYLSTVDGLHASAFDVVTLPIKKELVDLMNSIRPYVFEDARAEFDNIVNEAQLITTDAQGRLKVEDNRYKIIVARRQYEDKDRDKDIEKSKAKAPIMSRLGLVEPDVESVRDMISKFNHVLDDNLPHLLNSPWKYIVDSVKQDVDLKFKDESDMKILDIASSPNYSTKMVAEELPKSSLYCVDFSSDTLDELQNFAAEKNLHVNPSIISEHQDLNAFETSSIDIATCSFGLTRFSDPESILKEVHRVLRPGGTFITTTWDSIALERIGNAIFAHVLITQKPNMVTPISNLASLSTPRKLENMIRESNLEVIKVHHHEFPLTLGKDGDKETFNNAITSIHHLLKQLEESGVNPNAFNDARRVYEKMLNDHQLIWKDEFDNVNTVRNRYKFVVARRNYEDSDGILNKTKK